MYFYTSFIIIVFYTLVTKTISDAKDDIPLTKNKKRKIDFEADILKNSQGKTAYLCKDYNGRSYCGCAFNGKVPINFDFPKADNENAENFFKVATLPMCGNGYFDHMKQCALVNFFGDNPKNAPKDKHKKMLILLNGCVTCSKGGSIIGLSITHLEEGAGMFSLCNEEEAYEAFSVSGLSIKIPATDKVNTNTSSFTIPAILTHRICNTIFSETKPKDKYEKLKLHIKYICGDRKSTKIVPLPSIDVKDHKDRVAELTGLWINLDNGEIKQYVRKGLSYSKDNVILGWTDPHLDCWTKKEVCKLE